MAGPERRAGAGSPRRWIALCALALSLCAACASSREDAERKPLPPQTVSAVRPEEPPPSEPPVATPTPPDETVIVLDPGEPEAEDGPGALEAAVIRERERRKTAPPPVAVITDKNLAEFAEGETLTIASPEHDLGEPGTPIATAGGHDEQWWRDRGLEIRRGWREAADAIEGLEAEAAELRRRFYATDDPYVRDAQVKPEWDRVLRELEETRRRAAEGPREVERYLEEGRRAGALPGWLREGVELEPTPVLPGGEDEVEPGEPVVIGSDPPNR